MTRRDNEPTGEAESIIGRIDPKEMGSRAFKEDLNLEDKKKRAEKERLKREKREMDGGKRNRGTGGQATRYGDVLEATQDRRSLSLSIRLL